MIVIYTPSYILSCPNPHFTNTFFFSYTPILTLTVSSKLHISKLWSITFKRYVLTSDWFLISTFAHLTWLLTNTIFFSWSAFFVISTITQQPSQSPHWSQLGWRPRGYTQILPSGSEGNYPRYTHIHIHISCFDVLAFSCFWLFSTVMIAMIVIPTYLCIYFYISLFIFAHPSLFFTARMGFYSFSGIVGLTYWYSQNTESSHHVQKSFHQWYQKPDKIQQQCLVEKSE